MTEVRQKKKSDNFAKVVGVALRQAARSARRTARMYGTPIYVLEHGKVVAKKPQFNVVEELIKSLLKHSLYIRAAAGLQTSS